MSLRPLCHTSCQESNVVESRSSGYLMIEMNPLIHSWQSWPAKFPVVESSVLIFLVLCKKLQWFVLSQWDLCVVVCCYAPCNPEDDAMCDPKMVPWYCVVSVQMALLLRAQVNLVAHKQEGLTSSAQIFYCLFLYVYIRSTGGRGVCVWENPIVRHQKERNHTDLFLVAVKSWKCRK